MSSARPPWPGGGRFFRLADHLDRFAASLPRLRLGPGYDRAHIEAILHERRPRGTAPGVRVDDVHARSAGGRQLRDRYWAVHADPRYAMPVRYDEPE